METAIQLGAYGNRKSAGSRPLVHGRDSQGKLLKRPSRTAMQPGSGCWRNRNTGEGAVRHLGVPVRCPAVKELIEGWQARLARDLRGFADRGAEPTFEVDGNTVRAVWEVRGREQDALFQLDAAGSFRWVAGKEGSESYSSFLTSDGLADFAQLAAACKATIQHENYFVANDAIIEDAQGSRTEKLTPTALTGMVEETREHAEGLTSLFFLKGDAGAGKTTLLREATALQADRYLKGESNFLFFYVSAQGRELSNLRDAFSGELDDLRAAFTRDAIPTLARAGVLIPVVDGFDELLGTAGYTGAFSSLQTLLAELDALGTLVVSARSAFYDIEFLGRSGGRRGDAGMSITTVGLKPWSDDQLIDYLVQGRNNGDGAQVEAALANLKQSDRELLRRPFFASKFESFVQGQDGDGGGDLLEHLISAYIAREADKIVNANGDPVLPPDGHRHLFELAVGEMWESESRQLSVDDLRTVADLVSEEFNLDADQSSQLRAKVTSYAGFRPRTGNEATGANFAFEHEVYFDFFLGSALKRFLREDRFGELVAFLDKGVVPDSAIHAAVRALDGKGEFNPGLRRCAAGVTLDNRRRNLGALALAYAQDVEELTGITLQGLSFIDLSSGPAIYRRVTFNNCEFISVDLQDVEFDDCEAETSSFYLIKLNDSSRMDLRGLHPGINIRNLHHDPGGDVYAPAGIAALLARLGAPIDEETPDAPVYSDKAEALIELLERATRGYKRSTILYEGDQRLQALFGSPVWPDLKALLIKHGIITEEFRESRGANVPAYRLRVNVDELLIGQTSVDLPQSSTAGLWQDLRAL
jgi:NACHT domain